MKKANHRGEGWTGLKKVASDAGEKLMPSLCWVFLGGNLDNQRGLANVLGNESREAKVVLKEPLRETHSITGTR